MGFCIEPTKLVLSKPLKIGQDIRALKKVDNSIGIQNLNGALTQRISAYGLDGVASVSYDDPGEHGKENVFGTTVTIQSHDHEDRLGFRVFVVDREDSKGTSILRYPSRLIDDPGRVRNDFVGTFFSGSDITSRLDQFLGDNRDLVSRWELEALREKVDTCDEGVVPTHLAEIFVSRMPRQTRFRDLTSRACRNQAKTIAAIRSGELELHKISSARDFGSEVSEFEFRTPA